MYEAGYAESEKSLFSDNLIIENMFAQIHEEGNLHMMMDKITDYWFDETAVKSQDAFVTTSSGTERRSQTTQGVSMCIKWHDGNTTWVSLNDSKEAYHFQLADSPWQLIFPWILPSLGGYLIL